MALPPLDAIIARSATEQLGSCQPLRPVSAIIPHLATLLEDDVERARRRTRSLALACDILHHGGSDDMFECCSEEDRLSRLFENAHVTIAF